MTTTSSTLTSWAYLIWQCLEQEGINPKPLFKNVGLDPALLTDVNARFKNSSLDALWYELDKLGIDDLGIKVGQSWTPTTFHALGFAWLASSTLKEALERLVRYCRLVDNSLDATFAQESGGYRLVIGFQYPVPDLQLISDAAGSVLLKMVRMVKGQQFRPLEVTATFPASEGRFLEDLYGLTPMYDQPCDSWLLDRLDVESPLAGGNAELARVNEKIMAQALERFDRSDITNLVWNRIVEMLPSGKVSEEQIAEELHMSTRNLQRKLKESDTSFNKLLVDVRKSLATSYIKDSRMSLTEISFLLGFSEQASFTRAFRRWQGMSPREFRTQQQ